MKKTHNTSILPEELHDFRNFLYLVWKHLNLPDPTPIQYDVATYLQHGVRRIVIEAFRGVGKSWVTSAFVCWSLAMNPQEKILVVSASKERADSFSIFTKRLIGEMAVLKLLIPKNNQRDSNIAFDVGLAGAAHAPSVKSIGITGQITGSRATIIVADDVESMNNSATQMQREKLANTVREFDAVIVPNGKIVYLGTPQTEESIYNGLEDKGYTIRVWTGRYPKTQKDRDNYGAHLAPIIADVYDADPKGMAWKPTEPTRFNDIDLLEREASWGRSGFALQFMLDTALSDQDRYPLKLSDLIILDLDKKLAPSKVVYASSPELAIGDLPNVGFTGDRFYRPLWMTDGFSEYQGSVMFIDPSGRGNDELGYAVVNQLNGQLFVMACGGLKGGYEDANLNALALIARDNQVKLVLSESNFGDGMFTKIFTPVLSKIYPCTIDEVRHHTQKEKRIIDTLEPIMNQHRLIVDKKVVINDAKTSDKNYQLFYQLTRITKERGAIKHDDRLDALAGAVNYWVESMGRDVDSAAQADYEDKLMLELESFSNQVFSIGEVESKELTWVSV